MVRYVQVNSNGGPFSSQHDEQYLDITGQYKDELVVRYFEKSQQHLTNTVGEERKQAHLLTAPLRFSQGLSFFSLSVSPLSFVSVAGGILLLGCHAVMLCHLDMYGGGDEVAVVLQNAGLCNLNCVHKTYSTAVYRLLK